jgi:hypothetical protein
MPNNCFTLTPKNSLTIMAGEWIKMQKSLPRDSRVVRISSALNADRNRTVGGLFSAWCLFDEQTEDGKLVGYTPEILDEVIGFPGFARAMASVDWLEIGEGFLAVPRFDEHNGKSAKRRAQENVRKLSARDADKIPLPMQTKCALEKRREEKKKKIMEKPSLDDVVAFCVGLGLPGSDGEATFWKWEGNEWTNNDKPIKNWQATLRQWKSGKWLPSQKANQENGARSLFDTIKNPTVNRPLYD